MAFNRHKNSTPHNSVPLMRKTKRLREHLARMSIHMFLHAWSTYSDTLKIRIQHYVTPGQSLSVLHRIIDILFMRGSREFCQRGPVQLCNTDIFFKAGREDPNYTKSGPTSARQRNAISMAFRWRTDYCPPLNDGFIALRISRDPNQYC